MSRIVSLGPVRQEIYLIDHDDLAPTNIGKEAIFGKVLVGKDAEIDKLVYSVGGSGFNSAAMFAQYGHESILVSNIAEDAAGEAVIAALDRAGIDNSYLNFIPNTPTSTSVILLDSKTGAKTALSHLGATKTFENLDPSDLELIKPNWLYATSLNGDLKTLGNFFKKAKENDIKVLFNPGQKDFDDPQKLTSLLQKVDILVTNKQEAAQLVPGAILAELLYHLNNCVETVVITAGAMGGIAGNRQETLRFGIYEDVKAKDRTGAGDAFAAGFLAHYAAGRSFEDSLVFASANATSVVSKVGVGPHFISKKTQLHPMPMQKLN